MASLREKINQLDDQLVTLLSERAKLALEIGKAKGTKPVYDPVRESQVLQHVAQANHGPLSKGAIEDIYASILGECRRIQIKSPPTRNYVKY